ncbi:LamG-like jellyroll fold domain-containing protein [Bradyrhizobium sp. 14AA]
MIFTTATDGGGRLVSYTAPSQTHDYNNAGSFDIERKGGNDRITFNRNSVFMGFPPNDLTNGAPFRLIATVKSDGTLAYVNGTQKQTSTASGNWSDAGGLCLGRGKNSGDASYWDGKISEIGISTDYSDATAVAAIDAALQPADVKATMNAQAPKATAQANKPAAGAATAGGTGGVAAPSIDWHHSATALTSRSRDARQLK